MFTKGEIVILLTQRITVKYVRRECETYHWVELPNGEQKKVFITRLEKIK